MSTSLEDDIQNAVPQYFHARTGGGSSASRLLSQDPQLPAGPDDFFVRYAFAQLLQTWKRDTSHVASASRTIMHPAYQAIIGMGRQVLPLILEEIERHGGHWFWALHSITQEDPARGRISFTDAASAWLEWGRQRGLLRS